jgi:hypothetical protein
MTPFTCLGGESKIERGESDGVYRGLGKVDSCTQFGKLRLFI